MEKIPQAVLFQVAQSVLIKKKLIISSATMEKRTNFLDFSTIMDKTE